VIKYEREEHFCLCLFSYAVLKGERNGLFFTAWLFAGVTNTVNILWYSLLSSALWQTLTQDIYRSNASRNQYLTKNKPDASNH
jgi:Zn-dependent protease with chaperone function